MHFEVPGLSFGRSGGYLGGPWDLLAALGLALDGFSWISLVFLGFPWISLDFLRFPWFSLDFLGFAEISLDFFRFPPKMVQNEFDIFLLKDVGARCGSRNRQEVKSDVIIFKDG